MKASGAAEPTDRTDARRAYSLVAIPPQPYGKYTLIGKLGHGGMAEVNLAVVEGKGGFRKLTVIKRLHPHLAMEPGFVDMFLDEARLAARLNHPHCVQTYEVGEHGGNHYLAMEYLDGQGLERLLRMCGEQGRMLDAPIAARIVADALDGLAYAHELTDFDGTPLTVVHRDVSPQNIFVTYNGMVKLLDFGIAKAATHVVETRTGVIKGKYAYIAPEQALGQREVDQRSDLWSMGVVLWEALTGRRLFKSVNEIATLQETLQGEIKLPSAFRDELSTELDTICMRALQRDPDDRYQSAQEMKEDLERYLSGLERTPNRKQVARVMRDRFAEVIVAHKETLADCLKGSGAAVGERTIERLVTTSSSQSTTPPPPSGFEPMTPSGVSPAAAPRELTPSNPSGSPSVTPPPMAAPPPDARARGGGGLWWKALVVLGLILLAVILGLLLPLGGDQPEAVATTSGSRDAVEPTRPPRTTATPDPVPVTADPTPGPTGESATAEDPTPDPDEGAGAPAPEGGAEEDEAEPRRSRAERARLAALRRRRLRERRERMRQQQQQTSTSTGSTEPAGESGHQIGESGYLTLATTPWTEVSLGGRSLGTTPLLRVELPAGTHRLRLINREHGIDEHYRVTIRAGETLTRRVGLR